MKELKDKEKYKKILNIIVGAIVIVIILIKVFLPPEKERALKRLEKHLKNKYQDELVVARFGGYRGKYIGEVFAKKYEGTPRQYDSYVRAQVIVDGSSILDHYQAVISRENLVRKERPKLEEIFGKNILPIFDRVTEGSIYIFGSIENENDIKKYQEGIFEYIQHLKSVDNFKYVKLAFIVIDERVLEEEFYDLKIKMQLIDAKQESKTEEEFLVKRENIMDQIKITSTDKSKMIYWINRQDLHRGSPVYYGDYALGVLYIVSSKMIESQINSSRRVFKTEIGKTYDKIEDIRIEGFIENLKERMNARYNR